MARRQTAVKIDRASPHIALASLSRRSPSSGAASAAMVSMARKPSSSSASSLKKYGSSLVASDTTRLNMPGRTREAVTANSRIVAGRDYVKANCQALTKR